MRKYSRTEADQIVNDIDQAEQELKYLLDKLKYCGEYEYPFVLAEINRVKRKIYNLKRS